MTRRSGCYKEKVITSEATEAQLATAGLQGAPRAEPHARRHLTRDQEPWGSLSSGQCLCSTLSSSYLVIGTARGVTSSQTFERQLHELLRRGERVVLFGPRGTGKSTLVERLYRELRSEQVPCGRSFTTGHLDDITQALARAYPEVTAATCTRRAARSKLWVAADHRAGVLLLDQVTKVNNAMVGFLRRLVGGIAGVLLVFDVDSKQERSRLRAGRLGGLPMCMPLPSTAVLLALWRRECGRHGIDRPHRNIERQLLQAAAGRVGWVVQCAEFARHARYWEDSRLARINLLQGDTEIAVRFGQAALQALKSSTRRGVPGISPHSLR